MKDKGAFTDPNLVDLIDRYACRLQDAFTRARELYWPREEYLAAYRAVTRQLNQRLREYDLRSKRFLLLTLRLALKRALIELQEHEEDVKRRRGR